MDMSYQISNDGKYHCFWLIDTKLQIWKCFTERNPNLSNWTLSKLQICYGLHYKKFLAPAMSYDEYSLTSDLNSIGIFSKSKVSKYKNMQYLITYNSSSTKGVFVQQPDLRDYKYNPPAGDKSESVSQYIE